MKRIVPTSIALLVLAGAAALLARSDGNDDYRVAAVFQTAKGVVEGQRVKIAGAVAGEVAGVELEPGPRARMVLRLDRRFASFRADATCRILPEGLISENFVECDPGTSSRTLAPAASDRMPTVSWRRTSVPLSLQDVINVFSLPTDQRLRVIVNELGIATAGRGADINATLRRANPALSQARRALSILNAQRAELSRAIGQTDRVIAELGKERRSVRAFVSGAATVARTTARRRGELGQAIERLPATLDAVRPGLRSLDRAAANLSPLLDDLQQAAPSLRRLTGHLPSFGRTGVPALHGLARAATTGRAALRPARKVVARLKTAAGRLDPTARDLAGFATNLRDRGGIEGYLRLMMGLATLLSTYDDVSHLGGIKVDVDPHCIDDEQRNPTAPACSAKYSAPGAGTLPHNKPSCGAGLGDWWDSYCGSSQPAMILPDPNVPAAGRRARSQDGNAGRRARPGPETPRRADSPAVTTVPRRAGRDLPAVRPDSVSHLLDFLLR